MKQETESRPRGQGTSAGPYASPPLPLAHLAAMGIARLRLLFPCAERRRLKEVIHRALGGRASRQEVARLASAAYVYRRLGVADSFGPEKLQWASDNLPSGGTLVSPSTPFRHALTFHIQQSNCRFCELPAPIHQQERFLAGLAGMPVEERLYGILACRVGAASLRLVIRPLPDAAAVGTFLNDCLCDNPAQYGWLEHPES